MNALRTQSNADKTEGRITVWVCRECGYWRREQSTGRHQYFEGTGPGRSHELTPASYIFEGFQR